MMRCVTPLGLVLMAVSAIAVESQPDQSYPLWDGQETIAEYARRANLPPTKTICLGNDVRMELVLIPAGKFVMGTAKPLPVDAAGCQSRIRTGQATLTFGGGALLVLLGVVVVRAIVMRQRPQYSLARLLVMTVAAAVGFLGGLHWYFSGGVQREYEAAMVRFRNSHEWEKPAREVTLTRPFYLGKYEVTQEQYEQVMRTNPSRFNGSDLPVETVTWGDAQAFCKKVRWKLGATVRLPSEAEWEHACRAGTKTTYYTGDAETGLDPVGWYYRNSEGKTHPVGEKGPNAWGVHDMYGNVWEWCADWYGDYGSEATTDPQGPWEGTERVFRGGSWNNLPTYCRSANRSRIYPDNRLHYVDVGFRVVLASLSPSTPSGTGVFRTADRPQADPAEAR